MKKRKIMVSMLIMFLMTPIATMHVAATESEGESTATVTITAGSGVVVPVDPDDPTKPSEGAGSGVTTGNTGALTLDFVTNLGFGTQTVNPVEANYNAATMKPYIQVSDRRGLATPAGWRVTAQATSLENVTGNTITGAYITLKNGAQLSSTGVNDNAPTPTSPVVLNVDGTSIATIATASSGTGVGTWITRWYPTTAEATLNNSVVLTLPANPINGEYSSTITWTLSDAI